MATEQSTEKNNPPPEKKAPLPKVVTLNKARSDSEGQPSGLGLGAKVAPNVKRAAPIDLVEERLLGKVNAQKRRSASAEENDNAKEVN
ncbi:hypothetical protein BRADI_3g01201v3 [Brachypodium distachyon]|uniref:Uncharacterized protein n=1 Tax=Brachypodium distachyon TaxID=15368 RepID=A0A2K2CUK2_BRADI|nr:hypothetical protein BRADI_3g01201v3 [Brachypodium distachyon]